MNEKLYYITDSYGSCYALNGMHKLVVVNKEEFATKFTLAKANNIIQNAIKPMQRYQFILKEAPSESAVEEDYLDIETGEYIQTRFDDMDTNWNGYIEDLISFSSQFLRFMVQLEEYLKRMFPERGFGGHMQKYITELIRYISDAVDDSNDAIANTEFIVNPVFSRI